MLRIFSVAISVSPHVCFILDLILISMFLRYCTYELGIFHENQTTKCLRNQRRTKSEGWWTVGWLVGCLGFNGPLKQYFSLYRAVSQREGERGEKG